MQRERGRPILEKIDGYLNAVPAAACDVEVIGPFFLFLRKGNNLPFFSYARPRAPYLAFSQPAIKDVIDSARARSRAPRWEFIRELAPGLESELIRAGLPAPCRRPLMTVGREFTAPPDPAGIQIRRLIAESDMRPLTRVMMRAFGLQDEGMLDQVTADTAGMLSRGARFFAAFDGDTMVGAGEHTPLGSVTELAGIGTIPEYRQRGVASAVTSALVSDAFALDCDCVFLSAGDDRIARLYSMLGFRNVGSAMDTMELNA